MGAEALLRAGLVAPHSGVTDRGESLLLSLRLAGLQKRIAVGVAALCSLDAGSWGVEEEEKAK